MSTASTQHGNAIGATQMNPEYLIVRVDGTYISRLFNQKLPKNASPVGIVTRDGELHLGTGVTLTREEREAALASIDEVKQIDRTEKVPVAPLDLEKLRAGYERRDNPLPYLAEFQDKTLDSTFPEWARQLVADMRMHNPKELLEQIFEERKDRITDPADVVTENIDTYPALDLAAWFAQHSGELDTPTIAKITGVKGEERRENLGWWILMWMYMAKIHGGRPAWDKAMDILVALSIYQVDRDWAAERAQTASS